MKKILKTLGLFLQEISVFNNADTSQVSEAEFTVEAEKNIEVKNNIEHIENHIEDEKNETMNQEDCAWEDHIEEKKNYIEQCEEEPQVKTKAEKMPANIRKGNQLLLWCHAQ